MLFEEMPEEFGVADVQRALSLAGEVEKHETGDLRYLGKALVGRGDAERAARDGVGILVIVDGLVCQLHLHDVAHEHWGGIPLGPMIEMDGRAFPPYVRSFPTSVFGYVEARSQATQRDDARARYGDFLWCHRRSYPDAQTAIQSYRRAGLGSNPDDAVQHMTAARYLARAAELSIALNFERAETADVLLAKVRSGINESGGSFVWSLAHALGRLAQERPDESVATVEALTEAAKQARSDSHREKTLLESAEAIAAAVGRGDLAHRARSLYAEACEREADARVGDGWLVQVALVRDAIQAYERVGNGPAVQRLKDRLADAAVQAEGELHEVGAQVSIPNEVFQQAHDDAVERISTNDGGLLRLPFILGVWPSWSAVKTRFETARQEHPLQWLGSRFTIETEGRISSPPQNDAERDEAYLLDFLSHEVQMSAGLAMVLIGMMRESGAWSADAVVAALQTGDARLAAGAAAGVRAYEEGDYWTAVHVLVPQFERGIRSIGLGLSANVRRLVEDQGLQVATLGVLLGDPTVGKFLGEEMSRTLEGVFTQARGLNIRNNAAHGLLDPTEDQGPKAYLALMAVLTAALGLYLLGRAGDDRSAAPSPDPEHA
jgi:hypothetical protein